MSKLKIEVNYGHLAGTMLFIDPGFEGTGWAVFRGITGQAIKPQPPSEWGVLRVPWRDRGAHTPERLDLMTNALAQVIDRLGVGTRGGLCEVFIESPETWGGSAISLAATMKGDIVKLAILVGGLTTMAHSYGLRVHYTTPNEWKGQLTKEQVIQRLVTQYGQFVKDISNHASDAAGMGLALQGGL